MSCVHDLLEEAEGVGPDDYFDPGTELNQEKEEFVAVAPTEARQLYSLAMHYERKASESLVQAKYEKNARERMRCASIAQEYHTKSELLFRMFWFTLNTEFNLWSRDSVGVRRGWAVVAGDHPKGNNDPPPFEDFMRRLLGGGRE